MVITWFARHLTISNSAKLRVAARWVTIFLQGKNRSNKKEPNFLHHIPVHCNLAPFLKTYTTNDARKFQKCPTLAFQTHVAQPRNTPRLLSQIGWSVWRAHKPMPLAVAIDRDSSTANNSASSFPCWLKYLDTAVIEMKPHSPTVAPSDTFRGIIRRKLRHCVVQGYYNQKLFGFAPVRSSEFTLWVCLM